MSASPCAQLSENLLALNSREWDECRLKELGERSSRLKNDTTKQEVIIRTVVRYIRYISVKEFLPHFQGRNKPICDVDEEDILHLDGNPVEQRNKLGQILARLSKANESILPDLLLSLMDAYEEFNGGTSTCGHWTLIGTLLDEVQSVDKLPKYRLPDIDKDTIPFDGVEFNGTTALALAESLGLECEQFNSYEQICQKWIHTSSNCTFSRLVKALLLTRGLGRLVTGLCPPSKSNPPAVLTWFHSLSDGEWKKVAVFVGLEAEMKLIENKHFSHAVALRMFLRCLRIPGCDASSLNNILDLMTKHMKVKIKSANEVMSKAAPQQGFQPVNEAALLSAYMTLTRQPHSHDDHRFHGICEDEEVYKDSARPQVHQPHSVRDICEEDEVCRDSAPPQVHQVSISDKSKKNQSPSELDSSQSASDEICDPEQDTPHQQALQLLQACENKEWDTAKLMLETRQTDDKLLEVCNQDNGMTALHYACEKGAMETVELLLIQGADATRLTARGSSVLCYPKVLRSEELLERLLVEFQQKNCSVDISENKDLVTPLMMVCHEGDTLHRSAELLLNSGASPDGPQKASSHPLIIASEGGHLRLVKLLVGKQLDLNLQDKRGNTALLQACRYGYFRVADFLLEQPGVNIDRSDKSGTTPLFEAISSNHYSFTKKLLENKARVNIIRHVSNAQMSGSVEETPLSHACAKGFLDLVTLLIDNEADVNYICCGNVPPIAFAIICRQEEVIEKLLTCDRLDSTISSLSSPIIYAVRVENYRCAQRLIDRLGGNEKALQEATSLQLDHLVTHIKMLESVGPQKVSAQEMALKQQQAVLQKNIGSMPRGGVYATLDRFCRLCVQVLREYEDRKQVSLKDLAGTAKAISGNPDIAEFLLCVASHDETKAGGLRKQFLFGSPSPLTFLISQQIITPEDFFEQALRYFEDDTDDFYSQLIGAFHTIQHSEKLPYDIQGILNQLCTGQFQINLQVGCLGADSFPPDHALPKEFRVVSSKATIPVPSTGQYLQPAGDGFPINNCLPKEFQIKEGSAGDDVIPCEYPKQPKSHCTLSGAANCTANGNSKGWQPQCVNGSKLNPSNVHSFQGTGYKLGSSPSVSQPPEKQRDDCELTCKQKELQSQLKVGQQGPSFSNDVLPDGLKSSAHPQERGLDKSVQGAPVEVSKNLLSQFVQPSESDQHQPATDLNITTVEEITPQDISLDSPLTDSGLLSQPASTQGSDAILSTDVMSNQLDTASSPHNGNDRCISQSPQLENTSISSYILSDDYDRGSETPEEDRESLSEYRGSFNEAKKGPIKDSKKGNRHLSPEKESFSSRQQDRKTKISTVQHTKTSKLRSSHIRKGSSSSRGSTECAKSKLTAKHPRSQSQVTNLHTPTTKVNVRQNQFRERLDDCNVNGNSQLGSRHVQELSVWPDFDGQMNFDVAPTQSLIAAVFRLKRKHFEKYTLKVSVEEKVLRAPDTCYKLANKDGARIGDELKDVFEDIRYDFPDLKNDCVIDVQLFH